MNSLGVDNYREMVVYEKEELTKQVNINVAPAIITQSAIEDTTD